MEKQELQIWPLHKLTEEIYVTAWCAKTKSNEIFLKLDNRLKMDTYIVLVTHCLKNRMDDHCWNFFH